MANTKLTDIESLITPTLNDVMHIVDVSDTSGDAAGTSKKILYSDFTTNLNGTANNLIAGTVVDNSITPDKLANKYAASFSSFDFVHGNMTILATTHGVGATEDLVVTVKDNVGDDATYGVEISIASNGNVTISVNEGLEFSGRLIIRN